MLKRGSDLHVVSAFHVGHVGVNPGVGERPILTGGCALQVAAEIVEWISAWIVVVVISPYESANSNNRGRANQVRPARRDVESLDLRPLIRGPKERRV